MLRIWFLISVLYIVSGCTKHVKTILKVDDGPIRSLVVVSNLEGCFLGGDGLKYKDSSYIKDNINKEYEFLKNVYDKFDGKNRCFNLKSIILSDEGPGWQACEMSEISISAKSFGIDETTRNELIEGLNQYSDEYASIAEGLNLSRSQHERVATYSWYRMRSDREFAEGLMANRKDSVLAGYAKRLLHNQQVSIVAPSIPALDEPPSFISDSIDTKTFDAMCQKAALWRIAHWRFVSAMVEHTIGVQADNLGMDRGEGGMVMLPTEVIYSYEVKEQMPDPRRDMPRYMRDHMISFECCNKPVVVPKYEPLGYNDVKVLASQLKTYCSFDKDLDPLIDIDGGNLFAIANLAIIGKDELWKKYTDTTAPYVNERLNALGIDPDGLTKEQIQTQVTRELERSLNVEHVAYIGTDTILPGFFEKNIYQPIYHLDLFFTPLDTTVSENGITTLRYIMGIPDTSLTIALPTNLSTADSIVSKLANDITGVMDDFDSLLWDNHEIRTERITIPLSSNFNYDKGLDRLSPFCNGLYEKPTYYMPILTNMEPKDSIALVRTLDTLRVALINTVLVPANYHPTGSLRCRVIPIGRGTLGP